MANGRRLSAVGSETFSPVSGFTSGGKVLCTRVSAVGKGVTVGAPAVGVGCGTSEAFAVGVTGMRVRVGMGVSVGD